MDFADRASVRILLVDDMPNSRQVLREMLFASGFQHVTEAVNGAVALDLLRRQDFTLVISDWYMPTMAGVELVKQIRLDRRLQNMPFIMVTSASDKENVVEAVKSGVSDYIVKPCSQEMIERKITLVMSRAKPTQAPKTPAECQEIHQAFTDTKETLKLSKIANQQVSQAKDKIFELMSTELPVPVNSVMGILQELLQQEKDEGKRKLLATAFESSNQVLSLVNDFIELAQLESGSAPKPITAKPAANDKAPKPKEAPVGSLRVLVVDDVMLNRTLVEGLLKSKGHKLSFATNGLEALTAVEQSGYFNKGPRPFDLILMDMEMPVMDGVQATKKIREREAAFGETDTTTRIPIVGLSVHSYREAANLVAEAGMDEYLMKPVNPVRLNEVIRTISGNLKIGPAVAAAVTPTATTTVIKTGLDLLGERLDHHLQGIKTEIVELHSNPAVKVLDWENLFQAHGKNERVITAILKCFVDEMGKLSKQLDYAYSNGDNTSLKQFAHSANGSAAIVSAQCIHDLALDLEVAVNKSKSEEIAAIMPKLLRAMELSGRVVNDALQ